MAEARQVRRGFTFLPIFSKNSSWTTLTHRCTRVIKHCACAEKWLSHWRSYHHSGTTLSPARKLTTCSTFRTTFAIIWYVLNVLEYGDGDFIVCYKLYSYRIYMEISLLKAQKNMDPTFRKHRHYRLSFYLFPAQDDRWRGHYPLPASKWGGGIPFPLTRPWLALVKSGLCRTVSFSRDLWGLASGKRLHS